MERAVTIYGRRRQDAVRESKGLRPDEGTFALATRQAATVLSSPSRKS